MNVLDLFSGIGGFSLGLERAGMRTVAFCEIEPFQRAILKKHWPSPVPKMSERLTADRLRADGIAPDIICGGFPCQDISVAGKGAGIEGARSGLWSEYARIISEVRPRYVIVENVAALLGRGLERVLGDLAALGFSSVWHCIPASAVGAPHRRDRVWIVAHTRSEQHKVNRTADERPTTEGFLKTTLADTAGELCGFDQRRSESERTSDQLAERQRHWPGEQVNQSVVVAATFWRGCADTRTIIITPTARGLSEKREARQDAERQPGRTAGIHRT